MKRLGMFLQYGFILISLLGCQDKLTQIRSNLNLRTDPPVITWDNVFVQLPESVGTLQHVAKVSLSHAVAQTVRVPYFVDMGTTDQNDHNFTGSGEFVFTPGVISQSIPFTIFDDRIHEPQESFLVTLGLPSFGRVRGSESLNIQILQDMSDMPTARWQVRHIQYPEQPGGVKYRISVNLDKSSSMNSQFQIAIRGCLEANCNNATNNADYKLWDGTTQVNGVHTVKILAGNTQKSFDFETVYQLSQEGLEGIALEVINPVNVALPVTSAEKHLSITIKDNNNTYLPQVEFQRLWTTTVEGGIGYQLRAVSSQAPLAGKGPITITIRIPDRVYQGNNTACRRTLSHSEYWVTPTPSNLQFTVSIAEGHTESNIITLNTRNDSLFERIGTGTNREDLCLEMAGVTNNAVINAAGNSFHVLRVFDDEPVPKIQLHKGWPGNYHSGVGTASPYRFYENFLNKPSPARFKIYAAWNGLTDDNFGNRFCYINFSDVSGELRNVNRATRDSDYAVYNQTHWKVIPNATLVTKPFVGIYDDTCKDAAEYEQFKIRMNAWQNSSIYPFCEIDTSKRDLILEIRDNDRLSRACKGH